MKLRLLLGIVSVCLSVPGRAGGPSFDCRKAALPSEKTICNSADLSALDRRMAAAWTRSMRVFREAETLLPSLKSGQSEWISARNACGAGVSCLDKVYNDRIAILNFRPLPSSPSPVDRFVGVYGHDDFMKVYIQQRDPASARVLIDGAEPTSARWACHFEGIGTVAGNRMLATDADTDSRLVLETDGGGIKIPDLDSNYAANQANCGFNGRMNFTFQRARK
jgi:uncharacterized protein YecT (DUF1311 family)